MSLKLAIQEFNAQRHLKKHYEEILHGVNKSHEAARKAKAANDEFVIPAAIDQVKQQAANKVTNEKDYGAATLLLNGLLGGAMRGLDDEADACVGYTKQVKKLEKDAEGLAKFDRTIAYTPAQFAAPLRTLLDQAGQQATWAGKLQALSTSQAVVTAQTETVKQAKVFEKAYATADKYRLQLAGQGKSGGPPLDEPMCRLINAALVAIQKPTPDWATAINALAPVESTYKDSLKKGEGERQGEIDGARYEPVYEHFLAQAERARDEAKLLPASKEAVEEADKVIAQAKLDAKAGRYQQAIEALKALDPVAKATTAGKNLLKTTGDPAFRKALAFAEKQLEEFESFAGQSQAKQFSEFQAQIKKAAEDGEGKTGIALKDVMSDLSRLGVAIQSAKVGAEETRNLAQYLWVELDKTLNETRGWVPQSELTLVFTKFRQGQAQLNSRQPAPALQTLTALKDPLNILHQQGKNNKERYDAAVKRFPTELEPKLQLAEDDPLEDARVMGSRIRNEYRRVVQPSALLCDYKTAADLLERLLGNGNGENLTNLERLLEQSSQVANARTGYNDKFWERLRAARKTVTEFQKQHEADVDDDFGLLSRAEKAWDSTRVGTTDPQQMKIGYEQALSFIDQVDTNLKLLLRTGDGGPLGQRKESFANKAQWGEFVKGRDEALKAIRAIELDDPALVADERSKFNDLTGPYPDSDALGRADDPSATIARIKKLKESVDTKAKSRVEQAEKLKGQGIILAGQVDQGLSQKKKDDIGWFSRFKGYFETQKERVGELRAMLENPRPGVVQAAVDELQKMKDGVAQFDPTTDNSFTGVRKKYDEVKDLLDNSDLEKALASRRKLLKFRLKKEIDPEMVTGADPQALLEKLNGFEKSIQDAIGKAKEAMKQRGEIKLAIEDVKARLKELKKPENLGEGAPNMIKDLEARVSAAEKVDEGAESRLLAGLKSAQNILTLVEANKQNATDYERTAIEKDLRAEKLKARYESQRDLFKTVDRPAAEKVYKDTDSKDKEEGYYKRIADAYKDAKKFAEQGNYQAALERVVAARDAAHEFVENPMGSRVSSRGMFKKVLARYRKEADFLISQLHEIADAVVTAAEGGANDAIAAAAKGAETIRRASSLIDPSFFGTIIDSLEKTLDERRVTDARTIKEDGLRRVRVLQRRLTTEPVFSAVGGNPFRHSSAGPTGLLAVLRDLEANLRRA